MGRPYRPVTTSAGNPIGFLESFPGTESAGYAPTDWVSHLGVHGGRRHCLVFARASEKDKEPSCLELDDVYEALMPRPTLTVPGRQQTMNAFGTTFNTKPRSSVPQNKTKTKKARPKAIADSATTRRQAAVFEEVSEEMCRQELGLRGAAGHVRSSMRGGIVPENG